MDKCIESCVIRRDRVRRVFCSAMDEPGYGIRENTKIAGTDRIRGCHAFVRLAVSPIKVKCTLAHQQGGGVETSGMHLAEDCLQH